MSHAELRIREVCQRTISAIAFMIPCRPGRQWLQDLCALISLRWSQLEHSCEACHCLGGAPAGRKDLAHDLMQTQMLQHVVSAQHLLCTRPAVQTPLCWHVRMPGTFEAQGFTRCVEKCVLCHALLCLLTCQLNIGSGAVPGSIRAS